MKNHKHLSAYYTLKHWYTFKTKLVGEGIFVGMIAGIVVVMYRYLLEKAGEGSHYLYSFIRENMFMFPFFILGLVLLGALVGLIVKLEPMSSGSGIPQIEGVLLRKMEMTWWKVLIAKFIGGILSIGAGLSLGREGPSIQLGANVGQGFCKIFKRTKLEEKFLITSGSSAGLAAAFNAPLAGLMFSLEELHKNFSPIVLTSAMASAITADFVSKRFFGMKPVFDFKNISVLPQRYYGYIVILGLILGAFGALFNKSIMKSLSLYGQLKWLPAWAKPIIPFVIAGILGIVLPAVTGGGHDLIVSLTEGNIGFKLLFTFLIVKFFFTMISYGSGAPGGIFLPLLVLGALVGNIYGSFLHVFLNMDNSFVYSFIILAMAGCFTAIIKAPITGIILILEMTGGISHLLALAVISISALIASDLFNSKPVYELLLNRVIHKQEKEHFVGDSRTKVLIESPVVLSCLVDGKLVKDISWPANCLLIGVKRSDKELLPNDETMIVCGDLLIFLTDEYHAADVRQEIAKITEKGRFDD